jgi:hypothetical protein
METLSQLKRTPLDGCSPVRCKPSLARARAARRAGDATAGESAIGEKDNRVDDGGRFPLILDLLPGLRDENARPAAECHPRCAARGRPGDRAVARGRAARRLMRGTATRGQDDSGDDGRNRDRRASSHNV